MSRRDRWGGIEQLVASARAGHEHNFALRIWGGMSEDEGRVELEAIEVVGRES